MHPYVHYSIIYNSQIWVQSKCPLVDEWIKKLWLLFHIHNGIIRDHGKEGNLNICNNVDRTGEHYAKCYKPARERQMPYDFTYK